MGRWGTVTETPRGVSLTWREDGWVTEVEITKAELYAYVDDFVHWRIEHGLDDGLEDGLPSPLTDSFGECFGPQEEPYARMELQGLVFHVIPDAVP